MKSVNRVFGGASLILAIFMMICLVTVSGNVKAALSDSYTITSADNSINSSAWDLKYSESENAIKITMSEKNGEKEYTVRSKFFEVSYVMNKKGFGARMVKANQAQIPSQILDKILNADALKNQKLISEEQVDNKEALNLIASYLPDLVNDNYKYLVQ